MHSRTTVDPFKQRRKNFAHFTGNDSELELGRITQQHHLYTVKIYYLVIWLTNLHNPTNLFKLIFVSHYTIYSQYNVLPVLAAVVGHCHQRHPLRRAWLLFQIRFLLLPRRLSMQFRFCLSVFLSVRDGPRCHFTSQTNCCSIWFGLNSPNGCCLHSNRRE